MITKNSFGEIDSNDIFANDKLDREDAIENLSSLIAATKESLVMSINADWGAGKTTFIKLWKAYLEKEKDVKSIYFSAWEDDFSKEPLISILGEINKYITDNFEGESQAVKNFEKVKEFGWKVLRRGLPALVKGATGGVLDVDKGIEEAIGALSEQATKELIEGYSKDKEVSEKFKEAICELLENIDKEKPFVIFIDELDRCRPLYAIELLERIKHIFGIDGLIFVLSIDKKQLAESIKSQYGNIDTDNYLRRFIDLEYGLRNPNVDKFCDSLYYSVYGLDKIMNAKQIDSEYGSDLNDLAMFKYLVKSMNLSLREIEQIFIQINIIFKTVKEGLYEAHFRVFVFFISLKLKYPQLYFDLINKQISSDDIYKAVLADKQLDGRVRGDIGIVIKAIVLATSKTDDEFIKIIQEQKVILSEMTGDDSKKRDQSRLIAMLEHSIGGFGNFYMFHNLTKTVVRKIEFLDKFNFDGLNTSLKA